MRLFGDQSWDPGAEAWREQGGLSGAGLGGPDSRRRVVMATRWCEDSTRSEEKGMRLKDLWGKTPQGLIPGVGRLRQSQRLGVDSVQSTGASTDKASRRVCLSVSSVPTGF